jgi:hypothetical protein
MKQLIDAKFFLTLAAGLISLCQSCCSCCHAQTNLIPHGYYVLRSAASDGVTPQAIIDDPKVAGVSLRRKWVSVNPRPGVYNWSYFDREIARIAKAGKEVQLHVDCDADGIPSWLVSDEYQFRDKNSNHTTFNKLLWLPVPWDEDFLYAWTRFILAFGAHYDGHPDVVAVHVGGPNRHGSECSWPPEVKKVKGYSEAVHLEVWDTVFSTYREAFPNTCIILNLAHPIDQEQKLTKPVLDQFMNSIGMAGAQHNSLNASSSLNYDVHKLIHDLGRSGRPVGFQQREALGSGFDKSVVTAKAAKASWIEIYEPDRKRIKGPLTK